MNVLQTTRESFLEAFLRVYQRETMQEYWAVQRAWTMRLLAAYTLLQALITVGAYAGLAINLAGYLMGVIIALTAVFGAIPMLGGLPKDNTERGIRWVLLGMCIAGAAIGDAVSHEVADLFPHHTSGGVQALYHLGSLVVLLGIGWPLLIALTIRFVDGIHERPRHPFWRTFGRLLLPLLLAPISILLVWKKKPPKRSLEA